VRWRHTFSSIDAHAAGQPLRLITFGVPRLQAGTIREQVAEMQERFDDIRRWLLTEPRGYAGMTGAVLVPSARPEVDYGVIFMSSSGYGTMSGHGLIALATALIDTGAVPVDGPDTRITFDTPAGQIQARATIDEGRARTVRFRNVPAFRLVKDLEIEVDGRSIRVDVAFGGAWYAVAWSEQLGVKLTAASSPELARLGEEIKRATSNALDVVHPEDPALAGIYGTVIVGNPQSDDSASRNVTVFGPGLIDRSPCGTGMSATMACLAADGQLSVGDAFISESIIDTVLTGRIVKETMVAGLPGVITEIAGRGAVTGMHQFVVDPSDALSTGFVVG
jgi:trans-L-3-hydroxyproline dehydratase